MTDNPPFLPESLSISLSVSSLHRFDFLDLFVSRLPFNRLPRLCPFSLAVSHLSFLTALLPRCLSFCLSFCFYLPAPLLFLLTFIFPISLNPSLFLSVTSCHVGGPDSSVDAENGWWLTLASLTHPGWGMAEAGPWAGFSVTITMRSGRLTVQFGKPTGFTALVQQGQSAERTRRNLNQGWEGGGWRHASSTFQANLGFTDTHEATQYGLYYQRVGGSRCIVILSSCAFYCWLAWCVGIRTVIIQQQSSAWSVNLCRLFGWIVNLFVTASGATLTVHRRPGWVRVTAPRCITKAQKETQHTKDCCPQVGRKVVSERLDKVQC